MKMLDWKFLMIHDYIVDGPEAFAYLGFTLKNRDNFTVVYTISKYKEELEEIFELYENKNYFLVTKIPDLVETTLKIAVGIKEFKQFIWGDEDEED